MNTGRSVYIEVSKEARKHLALLFRVSDKTVYRALQHQGMDSELLRKIRHVALTELGGVRMVRQPEVETIWDADGYMRQYLPNHWMIEVSKTEGFCQVRNREGDVKLEKKGCTIMELGEIQEWVKAMPA